MSVQPACWSYFASQTFPVSFNYLSLCFIWANLSSTFHKCHDKIILLHLSFVALDDRVRSILCRIIGLIFHRACLQSRYNFEKMLIARCYLTHRRWPTYPPAALTVFCRVDSGNHARWRPVVARRRAVWMQNNASCCRLLGADCTLRKWRNCKLRVRMIAQ